jgi:hypothetical protein
MPQPKEKLEKFLLFIDEVANEKGNEWLKEALVKKFSSAPAHSTGNGVDAFMTDIKRTKFYLKNIDKTLQNEGFRVYKKVKEVTLRKQLIQDYREMRIAFINNDLLEYGRRMSLQLERCFDHVVTVLNGWELVEKNELFKSEVSK